MKAIKFLKAAISTNYTFLDKFKTEKEIEDYINDAIKEIEDLQQSNKELLNTIIEAQKVIKNVLEAKKWDVQIVKL